MNRLVRQYTSVFGKNIKIIKTNNFRYRKPSYMNASLSYENKAKATLYRDLESNLCPMQRKPTTHVIPEEDAIMEMYIAGNGPRASTHVSPVMRKAEVSMKEEDPIIEMYKQGNEPGQFKTNASYMRRNSCTWVEDGNATSRNATSSARTENDRCNF